MKKILSASLLLLLTGCTTTQADSGYTDYCSYYSKNKIALVTDTGGINDNSYNQEAWEGLQDFCNNHKSGANVIESTSSDQLEDNLNSAASNHEAVVASGHSFETAIYNSANAYPETNFVLIDGIPADETDKDENGLPIHKELPNVKSYLFKEQDAGYLAGYIAAKTTQTKSIGFIGGQEIPPVQKCGWGFIQGAYDADPTVQVNYQYSDTFEDTSITKSIADTMYSKETDIIFTAAGAANAGIIQSGIENNKQSNPVWTIGVGTDMDQYGEYKLNGKTENVILTSVVKEVENAVVSGLNGSLDIPGSFEGGTYTLGYEDPNDPYKESGIGLQEENKNLVGSEHIIEQAKYSLSINSPASTLEETQNKTKNMIINGEI